VSLKIRPRDKELSKAEAFYSQVSGMLLGIAKMSVKIASVQFSFTENNSPSPVVKTLSPKIEEQSQDFEIDQPAVELIELSTEVNELSSNIEELTSEVFELPCLEIRQHFSAEIFIFLPPHVFTTSFEDEEHNETRGSQTVSSPSFEKFSFLLKYGGKLTEPGKQMSDDEMKLLYEDIFKPLDFFSMLQKRSKRCS